MDLSRCSIRQDPTPDPAVLQLIRSGLSAYNSAMAGNDAFTPLTILARIPDGTVIGGLLGGTYWGWLVIEVLWIAAAARGMGLGSQLLEGAEQAAIERGCRAAHLDTMSFQAPDFYRKHGYEIFGILENLPYGHSRIFLKKDLRAPDRS